MKLRVNAPVETATPLLERFAQLGLELDLAEASRSEAIVAANVAADLVILPMVTERDQLLAQLEPWWARNGAGLLPAKRKIMELGGCIIGNKAGAASLQFVGGDDKAAVAALEEHRWAKPYLRVTVSVDKTATKKGLAGKHAEALKLLGFSAEPGPEVFVLDRAKQEGTVA